VANAVRIVLSAALAGTAFLIAALYPISPAILLAALALYAAALWRWPGLWLLVIPAILPNLDLSPWTGWLLIQEPDCFILLTLAVLLLRASPKTQDLKPGGAGGIILSLFLAASAISLTIGLRVPGVVGGSSIVYLEPENTLRAAKPLLLALALWPFLRARDRTHGDGLALLGYGMLLGLAGVVGLVALERAIFVSLWDFRADYRVAAAFSSMHVGGGHIGAYLAMALPFLVVPLLRARGLRFLPVAVMTAALATGGAYALAVTFARTAYAAALAAMLATAAGLALSGFQRSRALLRDVLVPAAMLAALAAGVVAAAGSTYMAGRFAGIGADLSVREANWSGGLAVRDHGVVAAIFGTGLGTFPRLWFDRAPALTGPSNFRAGMDGATPLVTLQGRQPIYFVQKIAPQPSQPLLLEFRMRARTPDARLSTGLCEKWLLYSLACASGAHQTTAPGVWESVTIPLTVPPATGHIARPIEFFLSINQGAEVDVAALRLTGPGGGNLLRNGDFGQGTTFWFFTDDSHLPWRIHNQFLTSYFEGGALGIFMLVLLLAGGGIGALRALARGERLAAPLLGALAAFAVSCLFDAELEAPRLALLFFLLAFTGLGFWHQPVPQSPTQGLGQPGHSGQETSQ
jgi:hypothetical protein